MDSFYALDRDALDRNRQNSPGIQKSITNSITIYLENLFFCQHRNNVWDHENQSLYQTNYKNKTGKEPEQIMYIKMSSNFSDLIRKIHYLGTEKLFYLSLWWSP